MSATSRKPERAWARLRLWKVAAGALAGAASLAGSAGLAGATGLVGAAGLVGGMAAAATETVPLDFSGAYVGAGGDSGGHDCLPTFAPGISGNAPVHVLLGRRAVALVQPDYHRLRRIYLDSAHPATLDPGPLGDSIGWWEGGTLVIETVGLKSGQTVVERLRPLNGGQWLEITVDGRVQRAERRGELRWKDDGCVAGVKSSVRKAESVESTAAAPRSPVGPGAVAAVPDLEGAWQIEAPVSALLTARDQPPPLNASSAALYADHQTQWRAGRADDYDESRRCQPLGTVRADTEGPPIDIIQGRSEIFIGYSGNRMGRIAYLHAPHGHGSAMHSYGGQWQAHWDGEVLVLEGTGFNGRTLLDAAGLPHSSELRVVQRLKLLDQGRRLEIRTAFGDAQTFTQAWQTLHYYRRLAEARLPGGRDSPCFAVP